MAVARTMLHGCDVWLNNPRRPLEACGTSGMKAALNGVLNCSILDGWWDECYDGTNGWAIASADDDPDLARRDQREADQPVRPARARDRPAVLRPRRRRHPGAVDREDEAQLAHARAVRHRGAHGASTTPRSCTSRPPRARRRCSPTSAGRGKALAHWKQRIRQTLGRRQGRRGRRRHRRGQRRRRTHRAGPRRARRPRRRRRSTVQALHGPIDSAGSFIDTPAAITLQLRPAMARSRAPTSSARPVPTVSPCGPSRATTT